MDNQKLEKIEQYRRLNKSIKKNAIVFAGSSLMEMFQICELKQTAEISNVIYNRGISGMTTDEMLEVLDVCVTDLLPDKVFINIGTNDMNGPDYAPSHLLTNYRKILTTILEKVPGVDIYVMAYYPVNAACAKGDWAKETVLYRDNKRILSTNLLVKELAEELGLKFININAPITDENGNLKEEYSIDGIHFYGDGYAALLTEMKQYL